MNRLGTPVRDVRKAREISLRQLQDLTGVNRAVWSQIENGRLLPEPKHIAALSAALSIPMEQWRIRFVLEHVEPA